jgi:hypothetical protein
MTDTDRVYRIPKKQAQTRLTDYQSIQQHIQYLKTCYSSSSEDHNTNKLIDEEIIRLNTLQYKIDPGRYGASEWAITKEWTPTLR